MPRLIWTVPALADVQRLYRFLAPQDAESARRAVAAIRSGARILAHQPHLGRPIDDMEAEYREWLIGFGNTGYIVLYRVESEAVAILAVRHQKEAGRDRGTDQ